MSFPCNVEDGGFAPFLNADDDYSVSSTDSKIKIKENVNMDCAAIFNDDYVAADDATVSTSSSSEDTSTGNAD